MLHITLSPTEMLPLHTTLASRSLDIYWNPTWKGFGNGTWYQRLLKWEYRCLRSKIKVSTTTKWNSESLHNCRSYIKWYKYHLFSSKMLWSQCRPKSSWTFELRYQIRRATAGFFSLCYVEFFFQYQTNTDKHQIESSQKNRQKKWMKKIKERQTHHVTALSDSLGLVFLTLLFSLFFCHFTCYPIRTLHLPLVWKPRETSLQHRLHNVTVWEALASAHVTCRYANTLLFVSFQRWNECLAQLCSNVRSDTGSI